MGGEAAGHARAKANTRRVARGAGRGRDWGNLKLRRLISKGVYLNVQYPGAVASLSFGVENIRNNLEVDILWPRWVARIGVTK